MTIIFVGPGVPISWFRSTRSNKGQSNVQYINGSLNGEVHYRDFGGGTPFVAHF